MSVQVEEEWSYKKIKSQTASRSAFAYKINKQIKEKAQGKMSYGYGGVTAYSREVILKITGGARSQKGILNGVQYISKDWKEEIIDSNGISYRTKEGINDAVNLLQSHVVTGVKSDLRSEKLTHNLVFSASIIAGVSKEDMKQAVMKTLQEKYPYNYFVCAYHEDTKKPHVHVVLNIHQDNGRKIDIQNKDFHEIRRTFCQQLIEQGYDLKASRRYEHETYNLKSKDYEELKREPRNIYQVIEFGCESYKADKRNSENNYLIYKTSNNKEVTIWGKELLDEISRNNIRQGDSIKIKKVGQTTIKVPVYGDDRQTIISWKETKRNQWRLEKADSQLDFDKVKFEQETRLDSEAQTEKQWVQREKFKGEKELVLKKVYEQDYKITDKLQYKPHSHKFKF